MFWFMGRFDLGNQAEVKSKEEKRKEEEYSPSRSS